MDNVKPSPTGLAIMLCDQIIEDKQTSKKSLIGIFNQIGAAEFPCHHARLSVFVSITEGRGTSDARLRIANEETGDVVAEVKGRIQFPDIHSVVEICFNFGVLKFNQPGLYSIEFYCDDALVLERRFHVLKAKPPPKGPPPAEM
jgi:hypothetical protein